MYDCSAGSEGSVELSVDMTALNAACSDLSLGWDYVNCYDVINNGNDGQ